MPTKNKHKFADQPFLWGAATAAHQVEGNNHNQWTEWESRTADEKVALATKKFSHLPFWPEIKDTALNRDTYISGIANDHFNRYEEDFKLLTDMNMNAYRFSIEWSRIEPQQGKWNEAAISHYRRYIHQLKLRDIEPIATLFHFSLPIWFAEQGGFEKRKNIHHFVTFAKRFINELGDDLKFVITINEPEVYAQQGYIECNFPPQTRSIFKAYRVVTNLATAHNAITRAIKRTHPHLLLSVAKNSARYVNGDHTLRSALAVKALYYIRDDYFLKKVAKYSDFLAINYYFSNRVIKGKVNNSSATRVHDLGWKIMPADIEYVVRRLYKKYKQPIIITENGLADQHDVQRQWWIEETLTALKKAEQNGVPIFGYLHWCLFDNFEWGFGTIPRFGLASIDYTTNARTLRPSAVWFGEHIKQSIIERDS